MMIAPPSYHVRLVGAGVWSPVGDSTCPVLAHGSRYARSDQRVFPLQRVWHAAFAPNGPSAQAHRLPHQPADDQSGAEQQQLT